jgi:hypothetical protein
MPSPCPHYIPSQLSALLLLERLADYATHASLAWPLGVPFSAHHDSSQLAAHR